MFTSLFGYTFISKQRKGRQNINLNDASDRQFGCFFGNFVIDSARLELFIVSFTVCRVFFNVPYFINCELTHASFG